jgi:hypothetical protein
MASAGKIDWQNRGEKKKSDKKRAFQDTRAVMFHKRSILYTLCTVETAALNRLDPTVQETKGNNSLT